MTTTAADAPVDLLHDQLGRLLCAAWLSCKHSLSHALTYRRYTAKAPIDPQWRLVAQTVIEDIGAMIDNNISTSLGHAPAVIVHIPPERRRFYVDLQSEPLDDFTKELSRRFAASFLVIQMGLTLATIYRSYLLQDRAGPVWQSLAAGVTAEVDRGALSAVKPTRPSKRPPNVPLH